MWPTRDGMKEAVVNNATTLDGWFFFNRGLVLFVTQSAACLTDINHFAK